MRINPNDYFWAVCDPEPESVLYDVLWKTNLRNLGNWFRGGRDDHNLTLFTDPLEAQVEAERRLANRNSYEPCSCCGQSTEFPREGGTRADWYLCGACDGSAEAIRRGFTHTR